MTPAALIAEARTCLGTPYLHHGRLKRVGLDCIGLVCSLMDFAGAPYQDVPAYGSFGRGVDLTTELDRWLSPVGHLSAGAIVSLWMRQGRRARHCGIVTVLADGRPGLLHTNNEVGRVVEHGLSGVWPDRIVQAYWIPGVTEA